MYTIPFPVLGLTDFDDLHAEELNLGAAVLHHLLGCRQHLPVLQNKMDNLRQSASQNFHLRCDIAQHFLKRLAHNLVQISRVPRW